MQLQAHSVSIKWSTIASALLVGAVLAFSAVNDARADLPADVQGKVDGFKKKLTEWAGNAAVVAAVKDSNAKGGVAGMSNAKWDELADGDSIVKGLQSNEAGKNVTKWEGGDKELGKLNLRDEKGNLVAFSGASGKPLLYNNASRAPFKNGLNGAWNDKEVKPDPTTQKKSVQIAAPVMDGGKAIGVIHGAVQVE